MNTRRKEAKQATLPAAIARLRLASLSDSVLALVLRHLPREALLRFRLTSQDVCNRVSMLLSDERVGRTLHFERRLRVANTLDGVPELSAFLRRLCSRFGIIRNTWSLSLTARVQADNDSYAFSCSGVSIHDFLAAVAATSLNIQLTISGVALGAAGAEAFAPLVATAATVTQLISLDVSKNKLGTAGVASLAPALSTMTRLKSLNLASNDLGPAGAASLAPALSTMTQLSSIHLEKNDLGAAGAASLAPALMTLTRGTELDESSVHERCPARAERSGVTAAAVCEHALRHTRNHRFPILMKA